MICYFSGFRPNNFYETAKKVGIKNYLYSFHDLRMDLKERYQPDYKIFIDSGGYSARKRGVKINIAQYADFLNQYAPFITIAANLDTNDIQETLNNQKFLLDRTKGVKILPVYHCSDYMHKKYRGLLDQFMKEFDYIGIGGVAGTGLNKDVLNNFLKYVFSRTRDKIKIHGFGITAERLVKQFPFYSVDSTSWQSGARYGGVMNSNGQLIHYSNKERVIQSDMPLKITTGDYKDRINYDLIYWSNYEKKITDLWKARGIVWKD